MSLIFVDIESTGLHPTENQITEVAYATSTSDPITLIIPHTLDNAQDKALEITHYYERGLNDKTRWCSQADIEQMSEDFTRQTLVGANPRFDMLRLSLLLGGGGLESSVEPWFHRPVDVESMAMGVFTWNTPKGLHTLAEKVREAGFDVPFPDHSAAGDVLTTRAIYFGLREIRNRKK